MAEKEVLSQEEIDALLKTVDETPEAASTASGRKKTKPKAGKSADAQPEESSIAVKTLNFTGQERIVKGQLPVLDRIYERAIRSFVSDIYQITAKDFEIKQDPLLIIKHRDFMEELPSPSLMSVYKFKPLRGKALIVFDSTFVYDLVDYYFGGSSQFFAQKDKTDFTATELKVMDGVNKKLISCLMNAWEPIIHLEALKCNEETNPQLITIAEPEATLLVARFTLHFGKENGVFHCVMPYSMLEPIKQQLELGASRPDDEMDPNWMNSLKEELMDVELTLTASMAETPSSLGKVMSWQIGDFVPLSGMDSVIMDVEGTPAFIVDLGSTDDKRALKIIKKISY